MDISVISKPQSVKEKIYKKNEEYILEKLKLEQNVQTEFPEEVCVKMIFKNLKRDIDDFYKETNDSKTEEKFIYLSNSNFASNKYLPKIIREYFEIMARFSLSKTKSELIFMYYECADLLINLCTD